MSWFSHLFSGGEWSERGKYSSYFRAEDRTGQVIVRHKTFTFYEGQAEYLSKTVAKGEISAFVIIQMARHLMGAGDQYAKGDAYESEVETYIFLLVQNAYDNYVSCEGVVTQDEIRDAYYQATSDYSHYTTIMSRWRELCLELFRCRKAELAAVGVISEKKTDSFGVLVDDEEQRKLDELKKGLSEAEAAKEAQQKEYLFYAGLGFAGLLVFLALVKKS
jgi:hypothetical protein